MKEKEGSLLNLPPYLAATPDQLELHAINLIRRGTYNSGKTSQDISRRERVGAIYLLLLRSIVYRVLLWICQGRAREYIPLQETQEHVAECATCSRRFKDFTALLTQEASTQVIPFNPVRDRTRT
ncbi:MAG: hypothetical protein Q8Q39_02855 [bacterium]|nr:hypothetical protein [bacterium]